MNQQNSLEIKEKEVVQNQFLNQKDITSKNSGSKFDKLKFLKNLRIQQDMRRLKNHLQGQRQLKSEPQRIMLQKQINRYQQLLKVKKKEFIQQKLSLAEERRKERQELNNLTNKKLFQVKRQNQLRRNKLESIVKSYKQQQETNYQKAINQRKIYRTPINIQEINQHQKTYFNHKLQKQKISSQNTQNLKKSNLMTTNQFGEKNLPSKPSTKASKRVKQQFEELKKTSQQKRKKMIALIFKRNQYGTRMEQQYQKAKVSNQKINRAKTQFSTRTPQYLDGTDAKWLNMMQNYKVKKLMRKPKLQTNNSIVNWRQGNSFQIHNLQRNYELDDIEKVQRLNILQQKYKYYQKIKSGNPQAQQALQLRTQANIAKANLLLRHNF